MREVVFFRRCGCFPRMRSIWFRKRGQDLWTMSEKSRGELQLFMSNREGCEQTGRLRNSEFAQLRKYICCTIKVQHCKSHEALNKNAGSEVGAASVRGRVFPLLRQTHSMLPRVRSIWFRNCGQDLWTPCAKESCRTPILNRQSRVKLPKCKPGQRRSIRRLQKP